MNFVLILLCGLSGWALRRSGVLPAGSHLGLNAWLVYLAVPAAALLYIPKIAWSHDMLWPVVMPLVVWCGAWIAFGKTALAPDDSQTRGSLILGCGLGNTSFVGFPLILAYYGEPGLQIAVVCDQASFLLLSTLGVATAIAHGKGERSRHILASLVRFPPFLGFLVALLLPGLATWGELPKLWAALAATLVPVALFSIGAQLEVSREALNRTLGLGIAYKLLLAPALVTAVLWAGGASGLIARVTILEGAMAAMATTSVLAVQYGLDTRMSNLLIGVGVPLSLVTTYLWSRLIEAIF